ncbi:hypothetical protein GGQ88_000680 [Novosphingobium hassiacum]|uniref:Uncharacterized protein n=1 Tax=Novosphingobium hassiacum TaxID=173676 RepID=A0A7W5ZX53_9SPHN|nr:hypothetical protein [Novosphingobium hassiacum]MBB3859440.1 hypothetical protein [Novosphingobium hassiacum]
MVDPYYGIEIPQELRDLADRHQGHIADLIGKLRTVGLDDNAIEIAVDQLMGTYRSQLVEAVKAVGGARA